MEWEINKTWFESTRTTIKPISEYQVPIITPRGSDNDVKVSKFLEDIDLDYKDEDPNRIPKSEMAKKMNIKSPPYAAHDFEEELTVLANSDANISQYEKKFWREYEILGEEFYTLQEEQLDIFMRKMVDYGIENITLGGNMDNPDDQSLAIQGILIRLSDKVNRLKNLLLKDKGAPNNEPIEDSWKDISNYALIALIVGKGKWKKA